MNTMMLHARCLQFTHPETGEIITIEAPFQTELSRMLSTLFGAVAA